MNNNQFYSYSNVQMQSIDNKNGNIKSVYKNYSNAKRNKNSKIQTSFNNKEIYSDSTRNIKKGSFIKKDWNNSNILHGELSENEINKILYKSPIIPTIEGDSLNTGLFNMPDQMGYTYYNQIPDSKKINDQINISKDDYYNNFFLNRGGNNK